MQTYPIVLGTAGHIDHGKTALVRALTGIDTDRLKEEKERGITTELGFAHLDLEGQRFGLVDVPGHERFIKSMVAGAGGLDLVMLAIAADEGIMPQTQEHLDICELLGVRRGVIALTKSDLVDDDWLELVSTEIKERLEGTFLAEAAVVPCSAKTGAGLDDLRAELLRLTRDLPARNADGPFRLPLDRVFTIKGFGTVVTGTVMSGQVAVGDTVVVHPTSVELKVRGLQVHGDDSPRARAGMRCAVNVTGASRDDLRRGDMMAHADGVAPSHILDVKFRYLSTSRAPLGRRNRVLIHHTTAQLMANLVLADQDQLMPGQEALAQLRLDATTPLAALPGDRFIARGFVVQDHYGTTIGGGEIVRVHAPKVRRKGADSGTSIGRVAEAEGDDRVAVEIATADVAGIRRAALARRLGQPASELGQRLTRLVEAGEIVRVGKGDGAELMHAVPFARMEKRAVDVLTAFHADNPHADGMSKEELRGRLSKALPGRIYEVVLATLARRNALEVDRDVVRRAGAAAPNQAREALDARLAEHYRGWALEAPKVKDVPGRVDVAPDEVRAALDRMLSSGAIVRIKSDYYVGAEAIAALRAKLEAHLAEHGQITPAEWKTLTGTSRKFSIPLAEHFDEIKLTLRVGDVRKRRG